MRKIKHPEGPIQGAFVRLRQSPDYLLIKQFFQEVLAQTDKDNREESDVQLYRGQGKALTLSDLLAILESPVPTVKKSV
jgi:hypothetical protein